MRKLVFVVVFFISCFPFQATYAYNCSIGLAASKVGNDYIDVAVSVESNPGFAAFMLRVHFDNKKLEPLYTTKGSLLPNSGFSDNLPLESDLSYVQTLFLYPSDVPSDGVLYTIRFMIKESVGERFVFYLDNSCEMLKNNPDDLNNPYDILFTSNIERFPATEKPVEIMFVGDDLSVSSKTWVGSVKGIILENNDAASIIQENNAVILAAYDSSRKMIYTKFTTVKSLAAIPGQPFTISDIAIPAKEGQSLELKLFLWNSLGQMEPLAENDVRIITATK